MQTLHIEIEDDLANLLASRKNPPEQAARELIALELYRLGEISSGKAAESLGMDKYDFIRWSGEMGIPFFRQTPEELENELEALKKL